MQDNRFMRVALEMAHMAGAAGEVPVGAVLVLNGEIIARAHNQPIRLHDPTAHAEVVALRQGGQAVENYRLSECELYVTIEPCIMCMGALLHARIRRLIFGALDPRMGAAGTLYDLSCDPRLNHAVEVDAGLMEDECRSVLQEFFKEKRKK
ncbi:MAG: tRNA adenosine(34) deaminase TadA [Deltaproteobacteria bacterium]|nr:tRNA adenosine(34) deaminase TadA [Deltaproteobacteria bacterium]